MNEPAAPQGAVFAGLCGQVLHGPTADLVQVGAHRLDGASQIALLEGGQDRGVLAYRDAIGVVGPRVTS